MALNLIRCPTRWFHCYLDFRNDHLYYFSHPDLRKNIIEQCTSLPCTPNLVWKWPPLWESPQYLCPGHRQPSDKSEGRNTRRKYSYKVQWQGEGNEWTSKHNLLACNTDPGIAPSALRRLGGNPCWSSDWGRGCKSPRWTHHNLRSCENWEVVKTTWNEKSHQAWNRKRKQSTGGDGPGRSCRR